MGTDRSTYIRRLLRAVSYPDMTIEHRVTALGNTCKFLVQVSLKQDKTVRFWASAVDADWRVARTRADEMATRQLIHFARASNSGMDTSACRVLHQYLTRQLAMEGGVWVEENARGHTQRTRRLIRASIFPDPTHFGALAHLADSYRDGSV
jgi:hypothetical protein